MEIDYDKIDELTLALMHLNTLTDAYGSRVWKSFDWDTMDRLHKKNLISNPKSKTKSVSVAPVCLEMMEQLFKKHFTKNDD